MIVDYNVSGVMIHEEKFIDDDLDVVSTIINSSEPFTLEIDGHSFVPWGQKDKILANNSICHNDYKNNSIWIQEGGNISTYVMQAPDAYADGRLVYDGMSTVLSSSR